MMTADVSDSECHKSINILSLQIDMCLFTSDKRKGDADDVSNSTTGH